MKIRQTIVVLFLLISISYQAWSQQNLFNIPSGDVTKKGKFFYQHQLNVYSASEYETKSHVVYGLGKNWDAGFNVVDLPVSISQGNAVFSSNNDPNRLPLFPLFHFTVQKQIVCSEYWQFNFGSQVGGNFPSRHGNINLAFMNYAMAKYRLSKDHGFLVGGLYNANDVYFGSPSQYVGFMMGYEIPLTNRFYLMGDLISGQTKKSTTTIGAVYSISKRVQLCAGALLSFPNQRLSSGAVFELNWYGYNFKNE